MLSLMTIWYHQPCAAHMANMNRPFRAIDGNFECSKNPERVAHNRIGCKPYPDKNHDMLSLMTIWYHQPCATHMANMNRPFRAMGGNFGCS
jgi:hypothetical protein